ncbi:uncharacterized protein BDR25DRAFT_357716 [Lindgomyces ingoldianus]|uniref:Uncharacterized protein n=1 Tax=Lindgomyces ingoldianus TaxID=673940 RepID=A0ACB6QNE2_9PLEO|nr:uncharacterized protein BDR25DRAFT_357716 [Lindgomyces ingoldianus]KAF2468392.1 hypothetical protein BDR25DRAFT_357716 [Lindgomyces ingoldianus]
MDLLSCCLKDFGKIVTEISFKTLNHDGIEGEFVLDEEFWTRSLFFRPSTGAIIAAKKHVVAELNKMKGFSELSKLFRLTATKNGYFLRLPYFAPETVEKILGLPFGDMTVRNKLDALKQRKEGENSGELYTSHDLAPIFGAVVEINAESYSPFKDEWRLRMARASVNAAELAWDLMGSSITRESTLCGCIIWGYISNENVDRG